MEKSTVERKFIMRRPIIMMTEKKPDPPEVEVKCDTTIKDLPDGVTRVVCPEHCKMKKKQVRNTDGYDSETPVCLAAFNFGILPKGVRKFILEKKTGQDKFLVRKPPKEIAEEKLQEVEVDCTTTVMEIPEGIVKYVRQSSVNEMQFADIQNISVTILMEGCSMKVQVICPKQCKMEEGIVQNTDGYGRETPVCLAASQQGILRNGAQSFILQRKSGQKKFVVRKPIEEIPEQKPKKLPEVPFWAPVHRKYIAKPEENAEKGN
ncbi:uncharacterized protein LOC120946225 [Rana temporaria]|uniref:uncharacterized protein LOC120946225 n=1 Tax=Rana temporaria TaxID=8407 RepID=UPI001AAC72B0|nr:uncharacterized protein LOC120946225 [Rana temporaria]